MRQQPPVLRAQIHRFGMPFGPIDGRGKKGYSPL
jgi:hypothetical protein